MAKRLKIEDNKKENKYPKLIEAFGNKNILTKNIDNNYINSSIEDLHILNYKNYHKINSIGNELDFCKIELTHQNDTVKELTEKGTKRTPKEAIFLQQAQDYKLFLENKLGIKENLKEIDNQKTVTLKWTGQKTTLYNVLKQLRIETGKDGQPLLNNTESELAIFLIQNVDVFKNNTIDTIRVEISKQGKAKISPKNIKLDLSEE